MHRTLQRGFTLIEMLVIAPIVILAIGAFLTVIISMTGEVLSSRGSNVLTYNVQDALNRIEQDVKLSTTFLATNSIPLVASEAQGYNNDATAFTNVGGTSGTSLILNTLATTDNPLATTSGIVYQKDKPNACDDSRVSDNTPMSSNIVYFVKGDTLWRRTIMPSNYANLAIYCAAPWQRPSCAPGYTAVFCKTEDIKLVEGVTATNFSVNYYSSAGSTTVDTVASDPNATLAARSTALQSLSTVGVAINASQNVAGRTIERSASVRVSRLDTNASTIAPVVEATIPSTPTLSSTLSNPTSVIYTWPKVDGASSYTFQYNINGGAWQTPVSNQNVTTYTVSTGSHGNVINGRVSATNSAGTSGYSATSTITIPLWTPLILQNGWNTYGGAFSTAAYTKTSAGMVILKGMIKGGSGVIANLPAGYRPATFESLIFENSSNQTFGRLDVNAAGDIVVSVGSNVWFSLDGISFMPAGSGTFTNFSTFMNGWLNYSPGSGDTNWAPASYMTDSNGRVHTRGLVRSGNSADGTTIVTLPVGSRPAEYSHVVNINTNANSMIGVDTSGNIVAKGGSNGFLSLMSMFIPSGRATGTSCTTQWCNLTLLNGWVHYGAPFSTPQYTKTADGVVLVKGLIRSGSTNSTMASLPAGYCPREQLLMTVEAAGAWGRVDITSGAPGAGCTIIPSAVSGTWTSFDSLSFYGEV